MNDDEMEELLYRLDERTMRMEDRLERDLQSLHDTADKHDRKIRDIDDRVQRNETKLKAAGSGLGIIGTGLAAALAKLAGLIRL